jgi:hypothetical protein
MREKLNYILFSTLILLLVSCKNEKNKENLNLKTKTEFKTDSISESYNEIAYPSNGRIHTISEFNTDIKSIKNIERPEKTIIRNLEIDTTQAFGIWVQDPDGPNADFRLDSESYYVVDYDGNGAMPYILDGNEITIYFNDFVYNGIIKSTKNDTLIIKWSDADFESKYVKFKK